MLNRLTLISLTQPITGIDFVKYSGISMPIKLKIVISRFYFVTRLRRLFFHLEVLGISILNETLFPFRSPVVWATSIPYSNNSFAGMFKQDVRTLRRGLSIISDLSHIRLKKLCTKLCDINQSACEKFAFLSLLPAGLKMTSTFVVGFCQSLPQKELCTKLSD